MAGAIDLNADLGEHPPLPQPGAASGGGAPGDVALLGIVTTAHLACGFHAGEPEGMVQTVAAAVAAGVVVGAHPSYADRDGFGRRDLDVPVARMEAELAYQVGALAGLARVAGGRVRSVKPHGALYHRVARDEHVATRVARFLHGFDPSLALVLPAGAPAAGAVVDAGIRVVSEGFCDRAYQADGTLVARSEPDALITDPGEAARRAVALALEGRVEAVDGTMMELRCDTLCVHGDTPGAVALAGAVRRALEDAGVAVSPFVAIE